MKKTGIWTVNLLMSTLILSGCYTQLLLDGEDASPSGIEAFSQTAESNESAILPADPPAPLIIVVPVLVPIDPLPAGRSAVTQTALQRANGPQRVVRVETTDQSGSHQRRPSTGDRTQRQPEQTNSSFDADQPSASVPGPSYTPTASPPQSTAVTSTVSPPSGSRSGRR